MKKLMILLLSATLFMAGCDSHSKPTDNISFGQAWGAAASHGSYWAWVIGAAIVCGGAAYVMIRNYKKTQDWGPGKNILLLVLLALFLVALLYPPAEIAANTTVEQASRGVYIR